MCRFAAAEPFTSRARPREARFGAAARARRFLGAAARARRRRRRGAAAARLPPKMPNAPAGGGVR